MNNDKLHNKTFGIAIIKSENSNFNSDFTHSPRRLPDENGTIYATDKAFKYAIRKYLKEELKEMVFVWRRENESGKPKKINEVYKHLFNKEAREEANELRKNLLKCIDVRLFGVTYAGSTNFSITGPVQLSYGINRYDDNTVYLNDILSPFRNLAKGDSSQTTIGNEAKALEVHYVYDFVVNPFGATYKEDDSGDAEVFIYKEDIKKFKEALNKSVTSLNSTTKIGSENELSLFIELKEDSKKVLPLLKNLVDVKKENGRIVIDLNRVFDMISKIKDDIKSVEIYYQKGLVDVRYENGLEWGENIIREYDLLSEDEIDKQNS